MPIPVVAAILTNSQAKILLARRSPGKAMAGKWEFPGGKIEGSETEEEAIRRELLEEMGIEVEPIKRLGSFIHHYERGSIELIAWTCSCKEWPVKSTDHDRIEWVGLEELLDYDLAEADRPIVRALVDQPVIIKDNLK